ncbi:MAG: nitroreductase family protein [Parasporobacterium sp.]|nr:nitroreductase family protein [Parasporobacterium sp.]
MFILSEEQCITCGTCVEACHNKALQIIDGALVHDPDKCNWCGHCLALCPRDAIMIDGDGYDVEDVEEFNMLTRPTPQQIRRQIMMRRSIRRFNEEEVTDDELSYILEAAKYAPTAKNGQDNFLLVVGTEEGRKEILEDSMEIIGKAGRECAETMPGLSAFFMMKYKMYKENGEDGLFYNAPVVIYVFSDNLLDGAICASTMMQMVDAQPGLGACYLQLAADPFNKDPELKKKYGIPENKQCAIAFALGHTDEEFFSSVPRKEVPVVLK